LLGDNSILSKVVAPLAQNIGTRLRLVTVIACLLAGLPALPRLVAWLAC
jgi:hypothetical protein